ncbi:unnamed protein product [Microthlaspi erraticum]|uniref:Uncharacterized protein n=1 Tax=Microthlaspi erraticum TaxID=1685480 RepID=A0A6D2IQU2_9BRAS|nr:unnamed protein product [Microthlaspi erraticum]
MPEKDVEDVDELQSTPPRDDTPKLTWNYRDKSVVVPAGRREFADAYGVCHMPEDKLGDMMTQMALDDGVGSHDIGRQKDGETHFGYVTRDTETGAEQVVLFKK